MIYCAFSCKSVAKKKADTKGNEVEAEAKKEEGRRSTLSCLFSYLIIVITVSVQYFVLTTTECNLSCYIVLVQKCSLKWQDMLGKTLQSLVHCGTNKLIVKTFLLKFYMKMNE